MQSLPPAWPDGEEISGRISQLLANMAEAELDAVVITSRLNLEYFTGFRSQFWASDTRPFFAVARRDSKDVALILNQGEERNAKFLSIPEVRLNYYDGYTDAGIDATVQFLSDLNSSSSVGFDYGADMFGRGSVALIDSLRKPPRNFRLCDAADLIWRQRLVKSPHELQAKREACKSATDGFFAGLSDLRLGISEYEYGQILKQKMIAFGADSVDWLPVRFAPVGRSGTLLNGAVQLKQHNFIWIDMGVRRADQISDLNRVAKVGKATPEQNDLYGFVRSVTLRLAEQIRPGMTGDDVFRRFEEIWSERDIRRLASAGRIGHGSGLALTEPPSLMAGSSEVILEDMVLHLEPKVEMGGGMFQTEEVFRVTPSGPEFLSDIAPEKLPIVEL